MDRLSAAGQVAHQLESGLVIAGRSGLAQRPRADAACYFGDPLASVLHEASPRCIGDLVTGRTEAETLRWQAFRIELWQALSTPRFDALARGIESPSLLQVLGNPKSPMEQSRRSQWVFLLYLHWSLHMQARHRHVVGVVFNHSTDWEEPTKGNSRGSSMGPTHRIWFGYLSMMRRLCVRNAIPVEVDLDGLAPFVHTAGGDAAATGKARTSGEALRLSCPDGPAWIDTLARFATRSGSTHLDSPKSLLGRRYRTPEPGERLETDWRWSTPPAILPITFRVAPNRTPTSMVECLCTALALDRRLTQERGMDFFGPQGNRGPLQPDCDAACLPHAQRMRAIDQLVRQAGTGSARGSADRPRFAPAVVHGGGGASPGLDLVVEPIDVTMDWHARSFDARTPRRFCLKVNIARFRSLIGDPDHGWLLDIDVHTHDKQRRTHAVGCGYTALPASSPLEREVLLAFEVQDGRGIAWFDEPARSPERLRLAHATVLVGIERVTGERLLHLQLDLTDR